jgi:Protein of unknown function (DUF1153)
MYRTDSEPFTIGPDGERMTAADLPDSDTQRWVPRRKARVVAAVDGGLISREAALARYGITGEEFDSWKAAMSRSGMRGLCVTKHGQAHGRGHARERGRSQGRQHGQGRPI